MSTSLSPSFQMPPRLLSAVTGRERRVGFEFEYTGVGLAGSAEIVQRLVGGAIECENRFAYRVRGTRVGDFQIESDSSVLARKKWEQAMKLGPRVEEWIQSFTEDFIPFEIVTPPIYLSDFGFIEELREELRKAGALGTHARFYSAYGLQFNPEMPDFRPETLLSYQRAFFLLYNHLLAREDVPLARRVLPFINPFPREYVDLVLDPAYEPSLHGFMRDYLHFNSTRNRALDWLPLFAHLDKELTFSYPVEVQLIKPRPTLHYRLPSSLIDQADWTIAGEWNKWVEVERLAADPNMIREMSHEFRSMHGPFNIMSESRWAKRAGELIDGVR